EFADTFLPSWHHRCRGSYRSQNRVEGSDGSSGEGVVVDPDNLSSHPKEGVEMPDPIVAGRSTASCQMVQAEIAAVDQICDGFGKMRRIGGRAKLINANLHFRPLGYSAHCIKEILPVHLEKPRRSNDIVLRVRLHHGYFASALAARVH